MLLTWRFMQPGSFFHIVDHPNHRSLHEHPTPRSGGLAIIAALLVALVLSLVLGGLADRTPFYWILSGILILALVGFMDDSGHLSAWWRLGSQFISALLLFAAGWNVEFLVFPGLSLNLWWPVSLGLSVLMVVWLINLFNFMDGMDGNAGGMAVIGFTGYSILGLQAGAAEFTLVSSCIAAASAGFLVWNFPPARIFMGDAGSSVLGFLVAALGLWGVAEELFSLWVMLILFSPFIVDASFTLVRRLLRGEKVWQAHREHLYQRLVQLGWGHRTTVLWMYILMLASAISAIMMSAMTIGGQWLFILVWVVIYLTLIGGVFYLEKRAVMDT